MEWISLSMQKKNILFSSHYSRFVIITDVMNACVNMCSHKTVDYKFTELIADYS